MTDLVDLITDPKKRVKGQIVPLQTEIEEVFTEEE
jgi:hypothetical protein